MNEYDEKWEDRINALLDGELSADDAELLKAEASDNRELARAIVEAYQLQQVMDTVHVERAPDSLRKRLRSIPRQQRSTKKFSFLQPHWAMALAAIPLVLITVTLMRPTTPSEADVAKARQEMAIAFAYLDKAGVVTRREIESTVGHTLANAVTGSVNKAIQSQNLYSKEKEA
jgi:anti-sigma factor RsiW